MTSPIAIVGMACTYPDARSPAELWENVLAQRLAFRRIPDERLNSKDYWSPDHDAPDRTYVCEAGVIEGYTFDRVAFRVGGNTFRSADMVHWLALDVAARALSDAGFPNGTDLPRETTGVVLGNTLTGEFSRANVMRLRWPYARRVFDEALIEEGWSPDHRQSFLEALESRYKAPFPSVDAETLAGGLANTIAGRICNHFDLNGGGFTVDGACASSLLSVANTCSALVAGDLDVALAGGVDLSLDPFELVGFAKTGALAPERMRVYDVRSAGFWPGEGCGLVVLMRQADAVEQKRRIYATLSGWGVSSDGSGGITRPTLEGQLLALRRAYRRAGFGIETSAYFEGHGTGTEIGDATELAALTQAIREAGPVVSPAAIGSIKANIGHTKAAAGVAGLIKAVMAVHTQTLPPTTGCENPHSELTVDSPALRTLRTCEPWPTDRPLRAGISAMGFGGINSHVVVEGVAERRQPTLSPQVRLLGTSAQDAELMLLGADDTDDLRLRVEHLLTYASKLSRSELIDLAARLAGDSELKEARWRAAIVVSSPAELTDRLQTLRSWLQDEPCSHLDAVGGVFLSEPKRAPRIGFLFPGQGSPTYLDGGALQRRLESVRKLYARHELPAGRCLSDTSLAQPAIVLAETAGLLALREWGVVADVAVGHSLGELTALHWARAIDEDALLRIAAARGKAMADLGSSDGAMAGIGAGANEVQRLISETMGYGDGVLIVGLNSPSQTVISGRTVEVSKVVTAARARGLRAVELPVSHAFHSPLVAAAVPLLDERLSEERFQPMRGRVISTVTGRPIAEDEDLRDLLRRQVTSPVLFAEAVGIAVGEIDLLIEVGPGQVLSGLVGEPANTLVLATDAGGPSLNGLLRAVGAAYVLGAPVKTDRLFSDRFARPFDLDWKPRFFASPCEEKEGTEARRHEGTEEEEGEHNADASALDVVRRLVARQTELPDHAIQADSRLLGDLHLNSITVGQLAAEASRCLKLPPPIAPTEYAGATVGELAQALEDRVRTGGAAPDADHDRPPRGVDSWIRTFTPELVERALPKQRTGECQERGTRNWRVIAPPDHATADALRDALPEIADPGAECGGVMVCLPPEPDERHVHLLLEGARTIIEDPGIDRFVLVQHGGGAASFARTLKLEHPRVTTCVVDVPVDHAEATHWVLREAMAASGHTEAHYDTAGRRFEPVLRLHTQEGTKARKHGTTEGTSRAGEDSVELGRDDVVLVTGGGKGIAAECALALAKRTDARIAIMGRSDPNSDTVLSSNLERMEAAGVTFQYAAADVTDARAVNAAVRDVEKRLGPITAIIHGAGANVPQLLTSLDAEAFARTLAPKVQGARNVLAAVDENRLRLLVTFGSIIARSGMAGEADYAVANEWLTRLTEQWQTQHPHCRCIATEWSVWSGVGMGQRLGRLDALAQAGVDAMAPDQAVDVLCRMLDDPPPRVAVVVTGRFGDPPTVNYDRRELPLLRFLERTRIHYPGVELVVEADLSPETDPYLDQHVFQGERLLPAVMGLEAMAQVVVALGETTQRPVFEGVEFIRPVVVSDNEPTTIRLAALARDGDRIEVVLRSSTTAFQVDHFRAVCCIGQGRTAISEEVDATAPKSKQNGVAIKPERDLYGSLLFQSGGFRRLTGYRILRATECVAEISARDGHVWFSQYLPGRLILGDPGARDAAIHAIQACIPHATILPVGVAEIVIGDGDPMVPRFACASERSSDGNLFTYDIDITSSEGRVLESWKGLRLRIVAGTTPPTPWVASLLAPYIERRVAELIPGSAVSVTVTPNGNGEAESRSSASDRAIASAVGLPVAVRRRPDGKPEVSTDQSVSVTHTNALVMAVAGPSAVGCDAEPVVTKPSSVWRDLLGADRFALAGVIGRELSEDESTAATRVWTAGECLTKAGAAAGHPLVLASCSDDGWVTLAAGSFTIATYVATIRDAREPLAAAILAHTGENDGKL